MTPGITIPQRLSVPGDPSVCVVAARVTVLLRNQKPGRAAKADGNHWHPLIQRPLVQCPRPTSSHPSPRILPRFHMVYWALPE